MHQVAPRRRRAAHLGPERRRPLVLNAALGLFVTHGYRGTSMDMIAEAAGVTKPVVYDCFPNKESLFDALLEREQKRLIDMAMAALPGKLEVRDFEAMLAEGYTALLTAVEASPDSWRVLSSFEYASEPKIARRVEAGRRLVTDRVVELTSAWLESRPGNGSARLAKLYAYLIVGASEASVRVMLDDPGSWTPRDLGQTIARVVARDESQW
jgi:AcrR family transcriptional regulator